MLCDTCQRQTICLPSRLAQADPQLLPLLERLKKCEMRIPIKVQKPVAV